MQWKLFADLGELAGDRRVEVAVDDIDGATVRDALEALLEAHPALRDRVLDDSGTVEDHINVLVNGESLSGDGGLETPVDEDDELALFPPVSGGE